MNELIDNNFSPVKRILVVENPISKNRARGRKQLEDLISSTGLPSNIVTTDQDPEVTASHLDILEPTDLLYVIGGDGTVNSLIKPLIRADALLLPTRSGNANDLAMSMIGRQEPCKVFSSYLQGDVQGIDSHPLEITIGNDIKFAINYASFGYGALASHYVNQPWPILHLKTAYEKLPRLAQNIVRFPHDGYMLAKAAADAKLFEYTTQDAGQPIEASDISFVHSERMAKLGRFNVRHNNPFFFASILTEASTIAMTEQFIKMMRAKMVGEYVTNKAFSISSLQDDNLYYQLDGEAFPLPEGNIGAKLADSSVRILSSRLK